MKGVKCVSCGFVGWADQETCKKCGAAISAPPVQSYPPPVQSYVGQPQPPYSGYQPSHQYWAPPTQNLKQGLAITSLVFGILNFFTIGLLGLGAISGLTFGIVALSKAKKRPAVYGGQGLAIAGVATNAFWLLVAFPIVMAIAIPNLLAARQAANEGSAIYSLRTIASAEDTYYHVKQTYGSLGDLYTEHLISSELANGTHYGYEFKVTVTNPVASDSQPNFEATAVPVSYGNSGRRSFLIDETGVVRAADVRGREATRSARPLEGSRSFQGDSD